jgi:hypothetical protein
MSIAWLRFRLSALPPETSATTLGPRKSRSGVFGDSSDAPPLLVGRFVGKKAANGPIRTVFVGRTDHD